MATNTKNRTELKQFFVKNAIPTQGNFADLIDAQLNQAEDGVFKLPDQPLGVVAVVGEQRRALQLYGAYPAPNPDWLISLNPKRVAPAVGNQAGFGIADGTGTTRLLLDTAGNLTVTGSITATNDLNYGGMQSKLDVREQSLGVAATLRVSDFRIGHSQRRGGPGRALVDNASALVLNFANDWQRTEIQSPLTVSGAVDVNVPGAVSAAWGRFSVTTTNLFGDGANQYVTIGAGGAGGIMFSNPHVVWNASESRASIRFGRSGGASNGAYWDVGTRANNAFSFAYNNSTDHKLYLAGDGSVCIGTTTPAAKLTVQGGGSFAGGVSISTGGLSVNGGMSVSGGASMTGTVSINGPALITGFTNARGIAVNNMSNTGVGAGVWLWGPNDSGHVIYSVNAATGGKSPANNDAVAGFHNSSHRMRFRTASGQGFLFENNAETALVDIASDTGNIWTRGAMYVGGSDIYFTQTNHSHTGIGNASGYAAIENSANHGALMILGRNQGTPQNTNRIVKLWDYLEVNGTLRVTGPTLQIGDWTLESAGSHLYIKRYGNTVARFSVAYDRFNVFRDVNGTGPYFYYNSAGSYSSGGNAPPP
jgi:hypothetical protein